MKNKVFIGDLVERSGEAYYVNAIQEDGTLILTKRFHPAYTLSYLGIPSGRRNSIKIIRRGNWFRKANNLPLESFCNLEDEAYFFCQLGEAELIEAGAIKAENFADLIEKIRKGEFDGHYTTEQIIMTFRLRSFCPVRFINREQGRLHAEKVLTLTRARL